MTHDERGSLGSAIRASHGYCLDQGAVIAKWIADHPHVDQREARSVASMAHGVPFPSIRGRKEGPVPVYPERPYYDARFHENAERGALILTPCLHERSK